jgi:hypothetical protein
MTNDESRSSSVLRLSSFVFRRIKNKIAERHIARDERYGVGEIRKTFFFIRLDVEDDRVPGRRALL